MMIQAHSIEIKFCTQCDLPHVYLFEEDDDEPFAMFTIDATIATSLRAAMIIAKFNGEMTQ
jgi:hypothetical protein